MPEGRRQPEVIVKVFVKLLCLSAILLVLPAAVRAQASDTTNTIAATVEALDWKRQAAMITFDRTTLDRLLDAHLTYTHSIGLVQTRQQLYDMLAAGNVSYESFTNDKVRWRVYPGLVVGTGNQIIGLTIDGNAATSHTRFTIVWRRVDAAWKCVAYQSTPVPDLKEQQTFR